MGGSPCLEKHLDKSLGVEGEEGSSAGRVRAPKRKGRTALPERLALLRTVCFSAARVQERGARRKGGLLRRDGGPGLRGAKGLEETLVPGGGMVLRTGLGDGFDVAVRMVYNASPSTPH